MALAMLVAASTATFAVFNDSDVLGGSTISTATVDIDFRPEGASGYLLKPIVATNLVPGEWTDWFRGVVYNTSASTDVRVYFYVANVSGAACPKTNLLVKTGHAGGNEQAISLYSGPLSGVDSVGERVELTGPGKVFNPTLPPNTSLVVTQKGQLDSSADNTYQHTSCTWDEVFVAESYVAP